jgi:hypothetical protein
MAVIYFLSSKNKGDLHFIYRRTQDQTQIFSKRRKKKSKNLQGGSRKGY